VVDSSPLSSNRSDQMNMQVKTPYRLVKSTSQAIISIFQVGKQISEAIKLTSQAVKSTFKVVKSSFQSVKSASKMTNQPYNKPLKRLNKSL